MSFNMWPASVQPATDAAGHPVDWEGIVNVAFQLAGYWAWTQLQRAGFPIGIVPE